MNGALFGLIFHVLGSVMMEEGQQSRSVDFYTYLRAEKRLAKSTVKRYIEAANRFKKANVSEIEYYMSILDGDTSSTNKRAIYYTMKYLLEMRGEQLGLKPPKMYHKRRPNIEQENVWKILDIVDDDRDRALLLTNLYTGLRPSEVLNIKKSDVDFDNAIVKIKNTKTYHDREIPINRKALNAIKKYLATRKDDGEYLFITKHGCRRISIGRYRDLLKEYAEKANIPKATPYMIRHTFATLFIENDGDIKILKELLGHSQIRTTEGYVHESKKMIRKGYEKACPEF